MTASLAWFESGVVAGWAGVRETGRTYYQHGVEIRQSLGLLAPCSSCPVLRYPILSSRPVQLYSSYTLLSFCRSFVVLLLSRIDTRLLRRDPSSSERLRASKCKFKSSVDVVSSSQLLVCKSGRRSILTPEGERRWNVEKRSPRNRR